MDDFAIGYLVYRFLYRVFDFFYHWYYSGSRIIAHKFMTALETIDRSIALKITLQYFFQPLYKDYSIIGRILGIFFRTARILVGIAVYIVVTVIFVACYLVWIAIPLLIALFIYKGRLSI